MRKTAAFRRGRIHEKASAELIKSDEMLEVAHDIESCANELAEELFLDNDAGGK